MGWLRKHSALKVIGIRARSASPFDDVPYDDLLHKHEQFQWEAWRQRPAALGQFILAQAAQEIQIRDRMPRKRGRPSALASYKEYKRFFLQEWARHLTAAAKRNGITQDEIAHFVEGKCSGWTGANWRELLRADNHNYRMSDGQFSDAMVIMKSKGWNIFRNGNLVTLWTKRLMRHTEFEEWVMMSSPHFHHDEGAKIS